MTTCTVEGCSNKHDAKGYCGKHYMRFKRHGDPTLAHYDGGPAPAADRFARHVERGDDCWIWIGANRAGYGVFWDGARLVYAHRWAYEAAVGPIPDGLVIDHLCRVPRCVRPDHLEPVSRAENTRRGTRWGAAADLHPGAAHHPTRPHQA